MNKLSSTRDHRPRSTELRVGRWRERARDLFHRILFQSNEEKKKVTATTWRTLDKIMIDIAILEQMIVVPFIYMTHRQWTRWMMFSSELTIGSTTSHVVFITRDSSLIWFAFGLVGLRWTFAQRIEVLVVVPERKRCDDWPCIALSRFTSVEGQIFLGHLQRDSLNGCYSFRIHLLRSCYSRRPPVLLLAWFWFPDLTWKRRISLLLDILDRKGLTLKFRLTAFLNRIQVNQNRGITILFQSIQRAITMGLVTWVKASNIVSRSNWSSTYRRLSPSKWSEISLRDWPVIQSHLRYAWLRYWRMDFLEDRKQWNTTTAIPTAWASMRRWRWHRLYLGWNRWASHECRLPAEGHSDVDVRFEYYRNKWLDRSLSFSSHVLCALWLNSCILPAKETLRTTNV